MFKKASRNENSMTPINPAENDKDEPTTNVNNSVFSPKRTIVFIWLGWVVIMLVYQVFVPARLELARPDYALIWTPSQTQANSQENKPYLQDDFLNQHVSWDSEFYLAIATKGYEAPEIHRIGTTFVTGTLFASWPFLPTGISGLREGIPLTFAFFPFYPLVIRLLSYPLSIFGLTQIATATLAGVLVSMFGTLAGMLALYELAKDELGDAGGLRAAFYLIIFPSGFFLAQVYTEGLFVGLAFSALVLIRRKKRGWAALLAVLATFTRAVGVALILPLFISWVQDREWMKLDLEWREIYFKGLPWKTIVRGLIIAAPVIAFFFWKITYYGMAFSKVEEEFFGRGLLSLGMGFNSWSSAFQDLFGENSQAAAYYAIEWAAVILGFWACIRGFRHHPDLAIFGFAVVFLSFTSGPAQGMHRYIIAAPPVFLYLSRLGKNEAFDRVWTITSVLLMGVLALLFTFDMWTG
jgi:hypothetical protein